MSELLPKPYTISVLSWIWISVGAPKALVGVVFVASLLKP